MGTSNLRVPLVPPGIRTELAGIEDAAWKHSG